jgi:hypothetical protein
MWWKIKKKKRGYKCVVILHNKEECKHQTDSPRLENSCPNKFSATLLAVLYLEQKISTGEKVVKIHT